MSEGLARMPRHCYNAKFYTLSLKKGFVQKLLSEQTLLLFYP